LKPNRAQYMLLPVGELERHLSPCQLGQLLNSDGRTDHKLT